ncbi:hypothetical protein ACQ1Q1_00650 [Ornithobacterium rhinotracheale]|uniref:Uncharacterized protein n=1 Tax=Ornithobacterium rhinotracheale (strain ATCC 51463 / DSM 15997 / CCUG 23171 / CIP 104009 / LMG 9086) TaxID=867902 RepID=I4A1R9_ORNRL|nr:hypothetical protein [Ornithobacterium rhinotracheale]AFL97903.1 hypothetical protein Ornrh_1749 [Ornithobacterium rhinotracheale DSM 15997]AIQ00621.1 hypothetical protein Q785_08595 [Ornithobacterium rhinotracheale ORT-UMN 88]KGB66210.1 hypothetical protein Q787_08410 [Ornithobacterium rhinotracheale H06-030791]MCK0193804.1 hypothetical protein [Ornithobacterium rhinotracheale]UOH63852.1 hypothetical protein MT993_01160 [Ornithobacterium rhinotracheale]
MVDKVTDKDAGQDMSIEVSNNMNTNVGNDHNVQIVNNHTFNSNDYQQNVKGNKTIDVGGSLEESTSETTHRAKNGDILMQSAGVAQVLGKIDAKVNKG